MKLVTDHLVSRLFRCLFEVEATIPA